MESLREAIDRSVPPVRMSRTLRAALRAFPDPPGIDASLSARNVLARLSAPSFTLLSYNTYLMDVAVRMGILLREALKKDSSIPLGQFVAEGLGMGIDSVIDAFTGAFTGIKSFFDSSTKGTGGLVTMQRKPACGPRADEIGDNVGMLAGGGTHDFVAALSELWTTNFAFQLFERAQAQVPKQLHQVVGPRPGPESWRLDARAAGSGLVVVGTLPMTVIDRLIYRDRGHFLRDSDWWASKGAMLTRLDGLGVEIASTHLHWGGELMATDMPAVNMLITGFVTGLHGRAPLIQDLFFNNPNEVRKPYAYESRNVRRNQLKQLAEFLDQRRDKRNVLIVTGDLNLNGNDPEDRAVVEEFCAALNLREVWAEQYTEDDQLLATGGTDNVGADDQISQICVPGVGWYGAQACDEAASMAASQARGRRFDYVLIENPTRLHGRYVDAEVLQRVPFQRAGTHRGEEKDDPKFCSDHLGLITRIHVTPRHVLAQPSRRGASQ